MIAVRRQQLDLVELGRRRAAASRRMDADAPDAFLDKDERGAFRTHNARKAVQLAELYASLMRELAIDGFEPHLGRPDGHSTAGGAMAKQPLSLVRGPRRIAFGHIDDVTKRCQLRTFDRLEELHRRRFDEPVPLDRSGYAAVFVATADLARRRGLDVTLEEADDQGPPRQAASPDVTQPDERRSALGPLIAIFVVVVLAALVVAATL